MHAQFRSQAARDSVSGTPLVHLLKKENIGVMYLGRRPEFAQNPVGRCLFR